MELQTLVRFSGGWGAINEALSASDRAGLALATGQAIAKEEERIDRLEQQERSASANLADPKIIADLEAMALELLPKYPHRAVAALPSDILAQELTRRGWSVLPPAAPIPD